MQALGACEWALSVGQCKCALWPLCRPHSTHPLQLGLRVHHPGLCGEGHDESGSQGSSGQVELVSCGMRKTNRERVHRNVTPSVLRCKLRGAGDGRLWQPQYLSWKSFPFQSHTAWLFCRSITHPCCWLCTPRMKDAQQQLGASLLPETPGSSASFGPAYLSTAAKRKIIFKSSLLASRGTRTGHRSNYYAWQGYDIHRTRVTK